MSDLEFKCTGNVYLNICAHRFVFVVFLLGIVFVVVCILVLFVVFVGVCLLWYCPCCCVDVVCIVSLCLFC